MKQFLLLFLFLLGIPYLGISQCPPETNMDSDGDGVLDCIDPCNALANSIIGNVSFESDFVGWTIPQNPGNFSINQNAANVFHGNKSLYITAPNSGQFETHSIDSEEFTLQDGVGYSFNIYVKRIGAIDGDAIRWALVDENGVYRNLNNYYNITENWIVISINNLFIDFTNFTSDKFRFRLEFGLSQTDIVVDRIEFFETSQGYDPTYEDADNDGNPDCIDPSLLIPANDLIENAVIIPESDFVDENLRLDLATANGIGGSDCGVDSFERVYYKFTATSFISITASLTDPNFQPINGNSFLIPYTAPDLNQTDETQLQVLPGYCTFSTSTTFTTTPGQSYYIQVCRNLDSGQLSNVNFNIAEDSSQAERDALVAFFNANGGTSWTNNSNWNTIQPVGAWFGVTVENGGVTRLDLPAANIVGTDLSELLNLPNLEYIGFFNNSIGGTIPDFSVLSNLETLDIRSNTFSFADFEPNFTANSGISTFLFSNQKVVDLEEQIEGIIGNDYMLTMTPITGTDVDYQWYISNRFDLDVESDPVTGANTNTLNFTDLQTQDLNTYICIATSPLVPGLEYRRPSVDLYGPVSQAERDALMVFYNALDGPNWVENTNWGTAQPVRDWAHITTAGNKVIGIENFGTGGWSGQIPTEIEDLVNLEHLSIALESGVTGPLPSSIGNLSNLKRLRLQATANSGNLPASIGNLTNLQELRLIGNAFTGDMPSGISNLTDLRDFYVIGSTFEFAGNANLFTGTLPDFSNALNLFSINAQGNDFSGELPDLSVLPNLNTLNITENLYSFADLATNQANNLLITNYFYSPQRNTSEPEMVTIPPGESITLDVNGMTTTTRFFRLLSTDQYQWFKDGEAIIGATESTYTINNPQPSDSGVYYCEITNTDVDGLTVRRADITLNVEAALSISDSDILDFKLYPNPTSNWITISGNGLQNAIIEIYDINGKKIKNKTLVSNTNSLNIEHLDIGIYILKLTTDDNQSTTKRFIKQ
ncbi:MAG: T9SS C-terminal target domain-containing protein [Winogradskyella sp.]|uniref:T9SS type A sorting domain-containing protein n=1 Tax=Winogradskyella sp. TaxID=1883156 RepID=UPI000F3E9AAC|nr:T9SS type A sorting domain-containing protein [Winogradskyella sp.]RNC86758.1 MAG: T9SS C-terminal target domain-containing protein [Winogradskyella sp.]